MNPGVQNVDPSPRMRLLTPGPVSVHPEVLAELVQPSIFHRYEDFMALHSETVSELERLFGCSPEHACVLLTGSGTLACEAVLSSAFSETDSVLVVSNGDFGERWAKLIGLLGASLEHLQLGHFRSIDPDAVLRRVRGSRPTGVVLVATETSTGMVNPVEEIGLLLRRERDGAINYFIDAVSAFGCEPLHVDHFGVTYCTSVLNKALEGPPGLSVACVDRVALRSRVRAPKSLYLDIASYLEFRDRQQTPFTPAIPQIRALRVALRRLTQEGRTNRRTRYRSLTDYAIRELEGAGVLPTISTGTLRSPAVVAFSLPKHVNSDALQKYLLERGLVVWFPRHYKGPTGESLMILSVMGEIHQSDIECFVGSVNEFCRIVGTSGSYA